MMPLLPISINRTTTNSTPKTTMSSVVVKSASSQTSKPSPLPSVPKHNNR